MEYNTKRTPFKIPEYGRHVQKMIDHAVTLKDNSEQQKCVDSIISFMGQLNPHLRDVKEFTHKLWDHLHIMSDFQLDIKSPYEKPEIKKLKEKPKKMDYPKNKIRFSYYGITIQKMIKKAIELKGEEREIMTGMIANQMKKSYILFNESSVDNNIIKSHLNQLSDGQLIIAKDFEFISLHQSDKEVEIKNILTKRKIIKKRSKWQYLK